MVEILIAMLGLQVLTVLLLIAILVVLWPGRGVDKVARMKRQLAIELTNREMDAVLEKYLKESL